MKTLHLTIKKKWFNMIASGEKKEEYREIKKHWITRLLNHNPFTSSVRGLKDIEKEVVEKIITNVEYFNDKRMKEFDCVEIRNGYSKEAPTITLEFKGIEIREGKGEWGAVKGEKYFVIKLGDSI